MSTNRGYVYRNLKSNQHKSKITTEVFDYCPPLRLIIIVLSPI